VTFTTTPSIKLTISFRIWYRKRILLDITLTFLTPFLLPLFQINVNDDNLQHVKKVCTTCYQTVRTISYNIENIMDTQKILRIENAIRPKAAVVKESSSSSSSLQIEDIARKYTNIRVKRVSANSPEKSPQRERQQGSRIVVVEALPPELKVNEEEVSPKKSRSFMCISCSNKFTNFDKLQAHLKTCNSTSPSDLKCFCGKVMSSRKNLELHVAHQHKQNKRQHICIVCKKVFSSLFSLQNHMASHKTAERTDEKERNES
jgi:uncharacterized Zn-finger protein